jgi:CheY-like chemotaxis protein
VRYRPMQILLVEDSPAAVRLLQEALNNSRSRCSVNVALSGEDALDFLFHAGPYVNVSRPDLVLLDLNVPGKGGQEVLQQIKSRPETPSP